MAKVINWKENYPSHSLLGKRYVFFSSLENDNPTLYQNATTHFDNINSRFFDNQKNQKVETDLSFIKNYLDFLKTIIKNEHSAEIKYLNNLLNKIAQKDKDEILKQAGITKKLEDLSYGNFEYIQILTILNSLKQENETLKEALQAQINNITIFEQNLKQYENSHPEDQLEKNLKELFFSNRGEYNQKMKDILMKSVIIQNEDSEKKLTWDSGPLQKIKDLIEQNINSITQYQEIRNIIREVITTGNIPKTSADNLVKRIVIIASVKGLNFKKIFDEGKGTEEIKERLNTIKNTIAQEIQAERVFANKTKDPLQMYKTLEEQALKYGERLGYRITQITDENDKISIIRKYCKKYKTASDDEIEKVIKQLENSPARQGQLTKELKVGIIAERDNWIQEQQNIYGLVTDNLSLDKLNNLFLENNDFGNNITYDSISSCLSLKVNLDSVSEIYSQLIDSMANMIDGVLNNHYTPGVSRNLKSDFTITWSWDDNRLRALIQNSKTIKNKSKINHLVDDLMRQIGTLQNKFLEDYYKKGKGTTKIDQAYRSYIGQMYILAKNTRQVYGKMYKDTEAREELINFINENILESVTVKEYVKYDPILGYEAGSLGASGLVINAIPNITKMYELGGITPIDANLIIEALLNSGKDMLAPKNLVENFKNYLLGGAALILFDEGFANSEKILKDAEKIFNIDGLHGPSQIHLLQLNNIYYPFSFVLQQIYNNLLSVYSEIINVANNPVDKVITKQSLYINSDVQLKTDKEWAELGSPSNAAARWNYMSEVAQNNTTITFMFMGGILDILEKLGEAFNISKL